MFEALESRQLLSVTVDVRGSDGSSKLANVTSVGQVVTLQLWATVTGSNNTGTDEALQTIAGSIESTRSANTSATGNLANTTGPTSPFNSLGGSQSPTAQDLNSDGQTDLGSNNPATSDGYLYSRAPSPETNGTVSGPSMSFHVFDFQYTVTSLGTSGQDSINFVPFHLTGGGFTGIWREDGVPFNDQTGTILAGAPFVIKGPSSGADTTPPTSSVSPLPATESTTSFTLNWSGSDNAGGSGLANYDIYYNDNGGAVKLLLNHTTATSTTFNGVNGHRYAFFSRARDNAGNLEAAPSTADAVTTVNVAAPDKTPPTSNVAALPATETTATFTISWSGVDNAGGSGIANYDIYYNDNHGATKLLLDHTTLTSFQFQGVNGHRYAFFSRARDNAGNLENAPSVADATTTVSVSNLDTTPPTSSVHALPANETTTSFQVSWSGTDNAGGSGLANYDIYYNDNGGAVKLLLGATTATSFQFNGVNGHRYAFYSRARDNAGNVEAAPSVADAVTTIKVA
jgi:hypothetical protein